MSTRAAAVAGTWYPRTAGALARDIDEYVGRVSGLPSGTIRAIMAPHAGLMFSGPIGAYAYKAAAAGDYDVAVLVGPSHFVAFDGVSLWPKGEFATPFGPARIDETGAVAVAASPIVRELPEAHRREHSLEMQLPFLKRLLPDLPIVPLLMGHQQRATIHQLAEAIAGAFRGRRALLVASTDLSHYFDAETAAALDAHVREYVQEFDPECFLADFEHHPEHDRGRYVACGGGPAIAVMMAARALGARHGRVLKYGHSGEISGDDTAVVGYMAAAFGEFDAD